MGGMFDMCCFDQLVSESRLVVLEQCMFGAVSRKPTMIFFGNCHAGPLAVSCGHESVRSPCIGVEGGSFATKKMATYPILLNAALAEVIASKAVGLLGKVL